MRQFTTIFQLGLLACTLWAWGVGTACLGAELTQVGSEVFALLQRNCVECHGPKLQKGGLRLDRSEFAFKTPTILPKGKSAESELVRRISLPKDHKEAMPSRGQPLSAKEIALVKAWLDAGAVWPTSLEASQHWAYRPPNKPTPPTSSDGARQPIDAFVHAKLKQTGLSFSPKADKAILLRRLSLDLIGLPPTLAELDAFTKGTDPKAYEKAVDKLLASPEFGVRWARPWLDYARYADSHGFQRDDLRELWPYRDWVVNALNADMPFPQFTIEQLAGDLLPNASEAQRIATGFNRSAPTNVEAGSDPEETRVNQIHDRVNTLGMVWLGSTLECAQCHDHKYDPFSMRDYYGLFAFFNNSSLEADRTNPKVPGSIQFKGPTLQLRDLTAQGEREKLQAQLAERTKQLTALEKNAQVGLEAWVKTLQKQAEQAPKEHVLDITHFESAGGATHEILADKSVLLSGEPAPDKDTYTLQMQTKLTDIRGIKLEALTDKSLPGKGPGRGDEKRPNFVLNNVSVTLAPVNDPKKVETLKFTGAQASFSQANLPVTNLLQAGNSAKVGWAINPKFHEPHWAVLALPTPVGYEAGSLLTVKLEQNFGAGRTMGRVRLSVLTGHAAGQPLPAEVSTALAVLPEKRTAKQTQTLLAYRLKDQPEYSKLSRAKAELETLLSSRKPVTTLVMQEDTPRMTNLFQRGDFRVPGGKVEPAVPSVLGSLVTQPGTKPTRLELARWLASRDNPLAARVTVNRWWAELFGHGLVTTPEDFGLKGERATHPELLDWLASEFMDTGWSMKKTLKTIVLSETYQQASRVTPELLKLDDRNLLYARGPRFRLEAELIRDNALSIAGLLNLKQAGPPIKPYQPEGLWIKVGGQRYEYEISPGSEKYRRGLYVVWKRAAPYPSFVQFDANSRMACRVNRPKSNTPLQALTLMNDPVYVEAALAFAKRIVTEQPQADDASRLRSAFRLATSRPPREAEVTALRQLLEAERQARAANAKAVQDFLGTFQVPTGVAASEFTAWYAIAAVLLNLDETISKG